MTDTKKPTVGEQSKRVAVMIGRMQPPTAGHYAVFDVMKRFVLEHEDLNLDAVPIVVVVEGKETSKDKSRNPLTGDERVSFMKGSGNADGVRFLKAGSAFAAFEEVRKAGFEPIAIAAGSDRAQNYLSMLDRYFTSPDDEPIEHYKIELPRAANEAAEPKINKDAGLADVLRYVDKDLPISMVSASLARLAVKNGEREKFAIIVGLSGKPTLATLMFNKIKAAMENTQ